MSRDPAKVLIFTAPSGSGKSTLVRHILKSFYKVSFSVSATTRDTRKGEKEGKDYYFLEHEEFKQLIAKDAFIEWEEVYANQFYGTLKKEVKRLQRNGQNVIFDIDVKGAVSLKEYFGDNALAIFVRTPNQIILEQRLRARKTETEASLKKRLKRSKEELKYENRFDRVLINDKLKKAYEDSEQMVREFLDSK